MRGCKPETPTTEELEPATEPVTRTPKPIPFTACMHYRTNGIRVNGRAVAWAAKAVAVEWDGQE